MDVSVVVPVYNASRFLHQCVDSLISQTLKDVEFIFVDDGSTDRSLEILQEYRRKDERIKILRQENMYAGAARNNGMKQATGKYLLFLDADDFFEPTLLESAFRCAEEYRAEVVIFGFDWHNTQTGENTPFLYNSTLPGGVFSLGGAEEALDERFFERCYGAAWNKLFLRSFVEKHGLQFQNTRRCNDTYFVFAAIILAERIKYLDKLLVHYRVNNPDSLQGGIDADRESFIECGVSVKRKAVELNRYQGVVKASLNAFASTLVRYGMNGPIQYEPYRRYYDHVKRCLIPDLFDAPEDFARDQTITDLYLSRDFAEFLFMQMNREIPRLKAECDAVRQSRDYRVGQAALRLPRWVKRLLTRR